MEYGLRRVQLSSNEFEKCCLNPCFNGIWSATPFYWLLGSVKNVLILVLMEYGLRRNKATTDNIFAVNVLILVLMEYGLRLMKNITTQWIVMMS